MKRAIFAMLAGVAVLGSVAWVSAKPEPGAHLPHRPAPSASGSAAGPPGPRRTPADLAESFRRHRPHGPEVQAELAELRATGAARRAAHRAALRLRFSQAALHRPDFVDELRKHARRSAFLSRAKLVATTELDEPKRTQALARIDQLMAKEQARHESAIAKLKLDAPKPEATSLASAAVAPAAPAGSTP